MYQLIKLIMKSINLTYYIAFRDQSLIILSWKNNKKTFVSTKKLNWDMRYIITNMKVVIDECFLFILVAFLWSLFVVSVDYLKGKAR